MEDYKATVRDGIKTVPHVQEIKQLFPDAPTDHFITHYGFEKDKPKTWNTEAFFGGRYEFTYQVDVMVDYQNNRIGRIRGAPHFFLAEITNVSSNSPDTASGVYGADYKFTEKDWQKVVAAKGDFTVIGIGLNTNSPVPLFEHHVRVVRRDRIQVE
jgi:hypothetical protein